MIGALTNITRGILREAVLVQFSTTKREKELFFKRMKASIGAEK